MLPMTTHFLDTFEGVGLCAFRAPIIKIYYNTPDFPNQFIARLFDADRPTPYAVLGDSLEKLHAAIPIQFSEIGRKPGDESAIVEVWM